VARSRYQSYLLHEAEMSRSLLNIAKRHEAANRYAEPGMVGVRHVGGDYTARDFFLMRVTPRDAPCTNIFAGLDEALSSKEVEVEL
jgi:hypothetical protein